MFTIASKCKSLRTAVVICERTHHDISCTDIVYPVSKRRIISPRYYVEILQLYVHLQCSSFMRIVFVNVIFVIVCANCACPLIVSANRTNRWASQSECVHHCSDRLPPMADEGVE